MSPPPPPPESILVHDPSVGAGPIAVLARHGVWLIALFVVLILLVQVRVEVQEIRKKLDTTGRAIEDAQTLNERLRLELDARRRAVAMELAAAELHLVPARVVVLGEGL